YDETHPFLQFTQLRDQPADPKKINPNALSLPISSGNTTILTQWNVGKEPTDAELTRLILCGSCYGMGGGKYDFKLKVDQNFQKREEGKKSKDSAFPGTLTGTKGYLHTFMLGKNLWETILLNLLTEDELHDLLPMMKLGQPFWESMPTGEKDTKYRPSYMGTLFPMDKFFCLLNEQNGKQRLQMTEGIQYSSKAPKEPKKTKAPKAPPHWDPGITIYSITKDNYATLWCDPNLAPWRQLPALLEFMAAPKSKYKYPAFVIQGLSKFEEHNKVTSFGLWVGGVAVSNKSGEQYVSGQNDYVDSDFLIPMNWFNDTNSFDRFTKFVESIKFYSECLEAAVNAYFKSLKDNRNKLGGIATRLFWEKMALLAQSIISLSEEKDQEKIKAKKIEWMKLARSCYDEFCPHETPRQMRAYTQNIPDFRPRKNNNDKKKGGKK
ncbi:MAG: type I-E CRISPR-associated protein Cse1/CasA, partial [Thermoguttaceae bacterium]|nr:type I-E CRISPR-associated protein Cse1/CasA [Thermoguttaceae bacterium]